MPRDHKRQPASIGHAMKSLFSSKKVPAVVEAVAVKETSVQEDIPVSTGQPVELVASRPGWSRTTSRITDVHANYLVLGETGLGKTTFIYNLVSGFKVQNPGRAHMEGATTMVQFKTDPNGLRTVLAPLEMPASNERVQISVQDMPGWGEDVNIRRYLRTVISFLLSRRAKDFEALGGGGCSPTARKVESSSSSQLKHSITACLYFLPPHRMKPIDIVIMSAVSKLVAVIPVIAKSDAMTDAELAAYRQEVNQMLAHPDKVLPDHGLTDFSLSTFPIEAGVSKLLGLSALPMAVNCSRHKEACSDEELLALVGPHGLYRQVQPVRQYAWGAVYPLARECQSDLLPLKRLLLGDHAEVLHALLDDSYKRYIEFCEEFVEYGEELQALASDMYSLIKPLEFDDYSAIRASLEKLQVAKRELQESNWQLLAKVKKAEAERKQLKQQQWK